MSDIIAVTRMRNASNALGEIHKQVAELVATVKTLPLEDALIQYYFLEDAYDALDEARKAIYKQVEDLKNRALPELMADKKAKTLTLEIPGVERARRFTTNRRLSASILPDRKAEGYAYLRENGAENLIQETVNSSSLSSYAKQMIEEQGMDLPDDTFKLSTMTYISITKA